MAQQRPTVRERGHRHPMGVAAVGGAEGRALEGTLEGAEMIRERQATGEIDVLRKGPAYGNGWEDGRFGPTGTFLDNANLARWVGHEERLAYYRGHRDGRRTRGVPAGGAADGMTDEEMDRFALVLRECERIRATMARDEAALSDGGHGGIPIAAAPPDQRPPVLSGYAAA